MTVGGFSTLSRSAPQISVSRFCKKTGGHNTYLGTEGAVVELTQSLVVGCNVDCDSIRCVRARTIRGVQQVGNQIQREKARETKRRPCGIVNAIGPVVLKSTAEGTNKYHSACRCATCQAASRPKMLTRNSPKSETGNPYVRKRKPAIFFDTCGYNSSPRPVLFGLAVG